MSDQVSGVMGWMFIMLGILSFIVYPGLDLLMGESVDLETWMACISISGAFIGLGAYVLTHPYWWWPTHAEDRVARIKENFDEKADP